MSTYITESYSLKYYGETMNYRKQQSRVEIWQKGSVGSSYPRKIGDIRGLSLAINGNEDIDAPIVKTILNLSMADTWDEVQIESANATKHGVWEEFYTPDSTAYLVKLFTKEEGDTNWEHRWSGYITPDNWKETIGYRGDVGIVARDNLGHLQDFDFDLQGDSDGLVSAYDIIDGALSKIAFPMDVEIADEEDGARALLLEADAASGSHGLFDACLAVDNFKGESWEKAFKDVLDSLGLTIRFVDGNSVVVTFIRNLPLCGNLGAPVPQTIEFYGAGTRMLVPAYKDVKVETDFHYKQDVTFPAKVLGAYGSNENFHWLYYDERRQQNISGDAARTDVAQTGRGWFSLQKAFVNPASYFITARGGGAAIVDPETTALLIANATDPTVQQAEAGYTFGKVNTPAAVVSLNVTASFTLSGRYLLRSGILESYEWTAAYVVGLNAYWWNGSQWKNTQAVWTETTENKMDFSAPMNLRDMDEGGVLTIFIRNIKTSTGFCVGVEGVKMECNDPSTSLKGDLVTVVNNSSYNVRAKRTPPYGFLSKQVVWNVIGNYPGVFWKIGAGGSIKPWPYQAVWSDGTENLAVPVQWAKQTLMFHHSTLQQIEGQVGVIQNGMWRFDRPSYYKGHNFLQQGGTWDLLSGHVTGVSLREYIDYATLWEGAATVAPTTAAFPQAGGSVSFLITCADDKEWDVTGLPDWLTASVLRGTGSGTVTLFAEVNDYGTRTRTIYIAGVPVNVSQAQRNFDLYVFPESIEKSADGGSEYITIQASNDTAWKVVVSDDVWLLVNGLDEWEGVGYNDAVLIYVQANETGSPRTGEIYIYDGEDNLVQTIPVTQSTESGGGGGETPKLTITTNVSSPSIELTVNGASVNYSAGMEITQGSTVNVTVSKSGYGTVTDSFTMPATSVEKVYTLSQSVRATESHPYSVSSASQNVQINVSDPSNHGWRLDYSNEDYFGYITGGGVTSGNVTLVDKVFSGTGNAVLYLTVAANSNAYDRNVGGNDLAPIYFVDDTLGSSYRTYVSFTQLGTSSSQVAVTSISLNKASTTINVGSSETLTATVSPNNATNKTLTWSTSNSSVATVDQNGKVYAMSAGSCSITARATDGSNKSSTCYVTVTGTSVAVTGVSLNKSSATVAIGSTVALTATVSPPNATNKNVTWSSSDTSIATVNSSGVVTGVSAGSARITVTTADGGFTAYCDVTVTASGYLSADNLTVKSVATSASNPLEASNMQAATMQASRPSSATWITKVEVDTSGSTWRVRMNLSANTSASSRSATITVTGTDVAGDTKTTTFTLTQNGRSSSDVPCTSMEIGGSSAINNSGNSAEYTAAYSPSATTQPACVWSLTDGAGNPTSLATLSSNGSLCTVTVLPGASNLTLKLRATNYYNSNVYAEKTITATYIAPSDITVTPASVRVNAVDTTDQSPVVTATGIQSGSLAVQSVSGFITSASIINGRLVAVFPQNSGSEDRMGSIILIALDSGGDPVYATVSYTQAGVPASGNNIAVTALRVEQLGGKVKAQFDLNYRNNSASTTTFPAGTYTLTGYDSSDNMTFTRNGSIVSRSVAALTTEDEIISEQWTGTLGMTVRYVLSVTVGTLSASYSGDGNDPID